MDPQTILPPIPPNQQENHTSFLSSRLVLISFIITFVLITISLSYYYFTFAAIGKNKQAISTIQPTQQQPTITPTVEQFAGWKTYKDEKNGYEFKYPSDWRIVSSSQEPETQDIFIAYHSDTINSYLERNPGGFDLSQKSILMVSGIPITRIKNNKDVYGREYAVIPLPKGTLILGGTLDFETNLKQINTFDQILSTFKFIDQNQQVDTANWKTYDPGTLPIQFKYPAEAVLLEENSIQVSYVGPNAVQPADLNDGYVVAFSLPFKLSSTNISTLKNYALKEAEERRKNVTITKELEEISINGIKGYVYVTHGSQKEQNIYLQSQFGSDNYIAIVAALDDPQNHGYQKTVNAIIASLRFTE